ENRLTDPASRARAAAYIANTAFKPMGPAGVLTALGTLRDVLTDEHGAVRMDWRMTKGEVLLGAATLHERFVGVRQQVSAIGRSAADRHGLVADGLTNLIQLLPGDAQSAQRAMVRQGYMALGKSFAFFIASQAILAFVLYLSETRYQRVSTAEQENVL